MSPLFLCLASPLRGKVNKGFTGPLGGAYDEIYGKLVCDRSSLLKIIVDFS